MLQHEQAPVLVAAPFQQYSGTFNAPFRENNLMAKADYQLPHSVHAFYRFSYFQNSFATNGGTGLSIYAGAYVGLLPGACRTSHTIPTFRDLLPSYDKGSMSVGFS